MHLQQNWINSIKCSSMQRKYISANAFWSTSNPFANSLRTLCWKKVCCLHCTDDEVSSNVACSDENELFEKRKITRKKFIIKVAINHVILWTIPESSFEFSFLVLLVLFCRKMFLIYSYILFAIDFFSTTECLNEMKNGKKWTTNEKKRNKRNWIWLSAFNNKQRSNWSILSLDVAEKSLKSVCNKNIDFSMELTHFI